MRARISVVIVAMVATIVLSNALDVTNRALDARFMPANNNTTLNQTAYQELMTNVWTRFSENFILASEVLDSYVKNNTTNDSAMKAYVSAYVLNSNDLEAINRIDPPAMYVDYNEYTTSAFYNFNEYLLHMAKYFETRSPHYAAEALEYYNLTTISRDKALDEMVLA